MLPGDNGPVATATGSSLLSWMGSSNGILGGPRSRAPGATATSPQAGGSCLAEHWRLLPAEAVPHGCCEASARTLAPADRVPFKGANGRRA